MAGLSNDGSILQIDGAATVLCDSFAISVAAHFSFMEGAFVMGTTYGYVRMSNQDQNEDRQLIALKE